MLPADIEFGFKDGRLALLQIRPFVESTAAQQNLYLLSSTPACANAAGLPVDLDAAP